MPDDGVHDFVSKREMEKIEEQEANSQREAEGKGRGYLFSVMLIGLGLALLIPWNTMIRTIGYLRIRLKDTSFEGNFANYMTASFTLSNTLSMGILVLGRVDEFVLKTSKARIIVGLLLNTVWLLVASFGPLTDVVGRRVSGEVYFYLLIVTVLLMGGSTALLQKGVYGYTAGLPAKYTPLMLMGQGAAGLVATVLSFGLSRPTPLIACVFFWSGIAVVLLGLLLFLYCNHSNSSNRGFSKRISFKQIREGYGQISFYALGILIVMMVTLSLYPSIMALVRPQHEHSPYSTVFLQLSYLTFDLGDLTGKFMPNLHFLAFGPDHLVTKLLPLGRFVFYPFFFSFNFKSGPGGGGAFPDWLFFLVLFCFACSNGYSNALLLMNAPIVAAQKSHFVYINKPDNNKADHNRADHNREDHNRVDDGNTKGTAGAIMGLFINLGLATGSLLSFACRAYICKCNPFLS